MPRLRDCSVQIDYFQSLSQLPLHKGALSAALSKTSTISFGTCDFEVRTKPRVGRRLPQAGGADGHRRQIFSALSILNDCRRCPHARGKPRAPTRGAKSVQTAKKRTNTRDAAIRHLGCLLPCIIFPHIFEQCRRKTHLICSIIDLSVYVTVRKPPLCKGSLDTLASHAQRRGAVKTSNDETAPKDLSYKPFLLRSIFSTSLKFAVGT